MKAIHIRNVHPDTLRRLKRLAYNHKRSLQGELHVIIENAARLAPEDKQLDPLRLNLVDNAQDTSWRREDIYEDRGR